MGPPSNIVSTLFLLVQAALVALNPRSTLTQAKSYPTVFYVRYPPHGTQDKGTYEIRTYPETLWLATTYISEHAVPSQGEYLMMLETIRAYNADSELYIPWTAPILIKIQSLGSRYRFTLMEWMALSPSHTLPTPQNTSGLCFVTRRAGFVYTKDLPPPSFLPDVSIMDSTVNSLKKLINDKKQYTHGYYLYAYFYNLYSEVWLDGIEAGGSD